MENIVGLKNINSICYLNALIQSLLSYDVFIKAIKKNKEKYMKDTNAIGLLFYDIIYKMENGIDIDNDNFEISRHLEFVGQNCSHEALMFIIDKLNLKLFDIKYEKTIFCTICDEITKQIIDPCVMYEYFTESKDGIFSSIINRQIELVEGDYKCDICDQRKKHVFLHDLILSSEIFVITFEQCTEKKKIKYDNIINLSTGRYKLVAKINHRGTKESGHYWMVRYKNKKTIAINDTEIKEINDNNNSTYTYMLFYIKTND